MDVTSQIGCLGHCARPRQCLLFVARHIGSTERHESHTQIEQSFHFVNFSYIALDVCSIIVVVVVADVAVPMINTCSINDCHVTFIFWFSQLKPHLGYCSVTHLSHNDAVILRRLRIGHTCVTHKYLLSGDLLSGDSQPLCDECKCSLTVKHIFLECCSLKDVRENYFTCGSLKELFENVDATTIMDFIKEVNFYHLV